MSPAAPSDTENRLHTPEQDFDQNDTSDDSRHVHFPSSAGYGFSGLNSPGLSGMSSPVRQHATLTEDYSSSDDEMYKEHDIGDGRTHRGVQDEEGPRPSTSLVRTWYLIYQPVCLP